MIYTKYLLVTSLFPWYIFISVSAFTSPKQKNKKLSECGSCKLYVKSFYYWMKKTSRGKFEGGDAEWEENRLKSYTRSEIRLVEIEEGLCSELTKYQDECYVFAESAEIYIEKWWAENDSMEENLLARLCTHDLAVCCPSGHYGPICAPCQSKCMEHARCDGDGTRQGSGQCVCLPGWKMVDGFCEAINLCHDGACAPNELCLSYEGKRKCLPCHKSCKTCSGPGRTECTECAANHFRSFTRSCINSHSPDGNSFSSSFIYLLPIVFIFLQVFSKYCKSKYLYFTAFQFLFIAVHYYYGFIHLLVEFITDIFEHSNLFHL